MTITNLTIEDHGETLTASYILREGNTRASVTQHIRRSDLYWNDPESYSEALELDGIGEDYLNQNLK